MTDSLVAKALSTVLTRVLHPGQHLKLPGFGPATLCQVTPTASHRPVPLRFVWHHIQPQEAGGLTEQANLVQLCDSCHYTIHRLMWYMAHGTVLPKVHRVQLQYAQKGFDACTAAGTVAKIPNEG
jgi:hypothetical protein